MPLRLNSVRIISFAEKLEFLLTSDDDAESSLQLHFHL
jgi:hypothetical protein